MRITICTGPTYPVPAVRGGAVQRLWAGLAREFVTRGHAVTVFAKAYPGQAEAEVVEGVRFLRWGGYEQTTSIARDLVRCLVYALRAAPRVPCGDVVVTNDFWMPVVLPRLRPSAGRVVASINRFPKKQFMLYGGCAAVSPVSESVAAGIRSQTPWLAERVFVVPNCVDAAFLDTPEAGESRGGDRPVRIIFAGRLHPEKGLALLAGALPRVACGDWECVMVGPVAEAEGGGGAAYAKELREAMRGLPVVFERPVYDPAALARLYDTADILVYPSIAETGEAMPLAPLEAMARGAVPLVSDLGAFREYLEPGVNGLVFNHRSDCPEEDLALKLTQLITDADMRREMAAAARRTAGRFSPRVIADRYLGLFEAVMERTL
jgi:glycosyltransferase involved in cell wall biosynthesis